MATKRGKVTKYNKQPKKRQKRDLSSKHANDDSDPKSLKSVHANAFKKEFEEKILSKFGLAFPDDLYQFYEFVENNEKTLLTCLELELTGPFDILTGRLNDELNLSRVQHNLHGRCYFDVPEMTTVLERKHKDGFHISYFRDDPKDLPKFLVSTSCDDKGALTVCGDNVFASVYIFCNDLSKNTKDRGKLEELKKLSKEIEQFSKQYGYSLNPCPHGYKMRSKNVVAKSFHKAGIVVPLDKTGVGYRELPETDKNLKKLFGRIAFAENETDKNKAYDELQEIMNLVQFANDECDYGMGMELGIDLFIFGENEFHGMILQLLPLAYQLLGRDLYGEIVEKHLENRQTPSIRMC